MAELKDLLATQLVEMKYGPIITLFKENSLSKDMIVTMFEVIIHYDIHRDRLLFLLLLVLIIDPLVLSPLTFILQIVG